MNKLVFSTLKKANSTGSDNWMKLKAEKVMSMTKTAFDEVITAENIRASFVATGTWSVNTDIYREDFLPSQLF